MILDMGIVVDDTFSMVIQCMNEQRFSREDVMIKKLTKHGNSLALVIERPVLDLMKVDAETPFEVSTDGQVLILEPIRDKRRRKAMERSLKDINQKYARALKRLAE
jgi:antitoxin MazE